MPLSECGLKGLYLGYAPREEEGRQDCAEIIRENVDWIGRRDLKKVSAITSRFRIVTHLHIFFLTALWDLCRLAFVDVLTGPHASPVQGLGNC